MNNDTLEALSIIGAIIGLCYYLYHTSSIRNSLRHISDHFRREDGEKITFWWEAENELKNNTSNKDQK